MKTSIYFPVVAGLVLAMTGLTRADMIWDNGAPQPGQTQIEVDENTMWLSDVNGFGMPDPDGEENADDFHVEDAVSISGAQWWGSYYDGYWLGDDPATDDFTIRIYESVADPNPGPGALVATRSSSEMAVARDDTEHLWTSEWLWIFEYSATFDDPIDLDAGSYFFSVQNDTTDNLVVSWLNFSVYETHWWWATSDRWDTDDTHFWRGSGPAVSEESGVYGPWEVAIDYFSEDANGEMAFRLVPEPASLVHLLGVGIALALLTVGRRRRR